MKRFHASKKTQFVFLGGAVLVLAALAFFAARRAAEPPTASAPIAESGEHSSEGGVSAGDPKIRGADDPHGISPAEGAATDSGAHVHESGFNAESSMNRDFIDKERRAMEKLLELTGSTSVTLDKETPAEVIEILVEGMDDLTAAKHLLRYGNFFPLSSDWPWIPERKYAAEYADRVLAKDPTSRDALLVKLFARTESRLEVRRRLMELYPDDVDTMVLATKGGFVRNYPEEVIAALERFIPDKGAHSNPRVHELIGISYERLDMPDIAAMHYLLGAGYNESHFGEMVSAPPNELRHPHGHGPRERNVFMYMSLMSRGERNYPSIWEERRPDAAPKQTPPAPSAPSHGHLHGAAPDEPHGAPPPPDHPDAPRSEGAPPPPSGAAMDMAAAYADFAKAYQSAFEMEYGLSEATPEGYMNALLGMARAFAKAGDAQHAQDAYNAVRKRHSREEVQQAFRRFDEQERLERQPSNAEDGEEDEEP
ncbi:MAG: hypothetical protein OXT69_13090 [Candidatus Poribacteria bacterium]|nr:hypothetical protein [Candidatus Poribacteria bacterium]